MRLTIPHIVDGISLQSRPSFWSIAQRRVLPRCYVAAMVRAQAGASSVPSTRRSSNRNHACCTVTLAVSFMNDLSCRSPDASSNVHRSKLQRMSSKTSAPAPLTCRRRSTAACPAPLISWAYLPDVVCNKQTHPCRCRHVLPQWHGNRDQTTHELASPICFQKTLSRWRLWDITAGFPITADLARPSRFWGGHSTP